MPTLHPVPPTPDADAPYVRLIHPIYASGGAISACALALCDAWSRAGVELEYWAPAAAPAARRAYHRLPVPALRARLHYKFERPEHLLSRRVERALLDAVEPGDLVYAWPLTSFEFVHEARARGARIAVERVNSHRAHARAALDRVYAQHGLDRRRPLTPSHAHGPYEAMRESRKLEVADAIVSPSPFVTDSIVAQGIEPSAIVRSSYAWEPRSFAPPGDDARTKGRRPRFAHVGSDVVRKGVGELLAAWRLADGPGELVVLGDVPDAVGARWNYDLARRDVEVIGWLDDLASFFAGVDVYVLASHEEGSPVSTYLALASGLPCIVSPAGGGGVVRDGIDGFVLDPFDIEGWAAALQTLASDPDLRREMGRNARERAATFTWERVAARRLASLTERLGRERVAS